MAGVAEFPLSSDRRAADSGWRIRVAIVDNHQVVSDGLRMLLDDQADMEVVSIASSVADSGVLRGCLHRMSR